MTNKKILLIDDNDDFRDSMIEVLLDQGFDVISTDDGYGGLAKLSAGEIPDLIISDVNMPGMDGIKFLKTLRKEAAFSIVPFILCSVDERFQNLPVEMKNVQCLDKDIGHLLSAIKDVFSNS